ncbi:hypothetical protein Mpt1_c11550 [Candidatus Methanoplasma termitum]|uniref:Glycosyltransferase RgtA/B/C/D-like domain-containing protein n=1 Tax=Candidatus Methanoplasma termitum TaxID=1577791 RepID=A0A0A7LFF8_9ARCH|nr:glycosyltransferase family 87 protein [Candidatus Methanoplasma termitum]AIZ57017.1 hypothetical protein Mpt1_c11550 [Candidatus Methanoplasma termitum]
MTEISVSSFRKWVTDKDEISVSIPFFCKTTLLIIVLGIIIRVALGFFMTHNYDMYHWGVVIQNINSGNGLYEITGYFYTPPWGYLLGLDSIFQNFIGLATTGGILTATFPLSDTIGHFTSVIIDPFFNLSVEIIFILSDLAAGYLVFWIIRDITRDRRKAVIGFALWFLCPFLITAGTVSEMFDTLTVVMTLLSIIFLRKGRYVESGVMLCLATLTKFFPGFFILVIIAYIWSKGKETGTSKKNVLMFLIGVVATAFVILLPQILDGTLADCFLFITSRVSEGISTGMVGRLGGYAAPVVYVITIVVSAIFALRIIRNRTMANMDGLLFDALLVTAAVMFLYPPQPHYLLLLLPFVIFAMLSDRRYRAPLILLMIGATTAAVAGGPMDLLSIAGFTDLFGLDSMVHAVEVYSSPLFGIGIISGINLVAGAGYVLQYISILFILWVRFGEEIKRRIMKKSTAGSVDRSSDSED